MSLTNSLDEQYAQLIALRASEVELLDGPDEALKILGAPTDPIRMRATLTILIRAERHENAFDVIHDVVPHDKWVDLAAYIYAARGDFTNARSFVVRADESPELLVMRRTRLAFAEGAIEWLRMQRGNGSLLGPQSSCEQEVDLALAVIDTLDPILSLVKANRAINGDLQLEAVMHAVHCAHISSEKRGLSQFTAWLVKHVPIPLLVAELSLRKIVEPPVTLAGRLRTEHPGEFQAQVLAAVADRELFDRANEAFDSLIALSSKAATAAERESVCVGLFETVGRCKPGRIDKAIQVVSEIRPSDSRLLSLLRVFKHIESADLQSAKQELETVRDEADGVWWQAHAQLAERMGDEATAEIAWSKASELIPHGDILRRSVQASLDRRKFENAVGGLKKLLASSPPSERDLSALSFALVQLGDYAQAADYLRQLVEAHSSNPEYRIGLAQCLARSAAIPAAINALQPLCDSEEAPPEAILLQSELLESVGRPQDGFRLLEGIAADHWDEPRFLLSYMHRGYAAGEDRLAHKAFVRLFELRGEGKVPSEMMQEGTLEELLQHGEEYRSRRETLQEAVVGGRMPWLFAEDVLGNPPSWAWVLHTQPLNWSSEERQNRAALTIYATNGFAVSKTGEKGRIEVIEAPKNLKRAVIDLSALVTLHELGRLQVVAESLDKLILPASYGGLQIRDDGRFGQHQASQESKLVAIRTEIERGRIRIIDAGSTNLRLVDEYSDESERHAYRLQDIICVLRRAQRSNPDDIAELEAVAHKPSTADEGHPLFVIGSTLLIDMLTLRTLAGQPVFETVLQVFDVYLESKQRDRLHNEIQARQSAREAKQSHDALWTTVAELKARSLLEWIPLSRSSEIAEDGGESEDDSESVHLDSVNLAQELDLPLIADDRVLHVIRQQKASEPTTCALSSDQLLLWMLEGEYSSIQEVASAFRLLMHWRYRFIVPTASILYSWAYESKATPPGDALLDAAFYLHDCLSDPGLHCGFEQSEPPMPMALKFVTSWVDSITSFLADVWKDEQFSDDIAVDLTRWVAQELIPSCPRGLWWHAVGLNLARFMSNSTIQLAMVRFPFVRDIRRANLGLRTLAQSLGFSEDQFLTAAVEASMRHDDKFPPNKLETLDLAFSRRMMQVALLHRADQGLDPYHIYGFQALGLLKDVSAPDVPAELPEAMRDPNHVARVTAPPGPQVFLREQASVTVIDVDSMLLNPIREVRAAALDFLQTAALDSDPWLTPPTLSLIEQYLSDVRAEEINQWRTAGLRLTPVIHSDLFLHFAGLRQSFLARYDDGINQYLPKVMQPKFDSLVQLRPPLWSPSEQIQEIQTWIKGFAAFDSLEHALTEYVNHCGYVPLASELSAAAVAKEWSAQHPADKIAWTDLWAWAEMTGSPMAKYHAVTVALHLPEARPSASTDLFWNAVIEILDVTQADEESASSESMWQFYCELAGHYLKHVEALYPGQHGERVACYGWWLAAKAGQIVGPNERQAKTALDRIVRPEAELSFSRWLIARSPVTPSVFRYCTLYMRSVWSMSLLAQLSLARQSLPLEEWPPEVCPTIGAVLRGYLLASPLAAKSEVAPIFAFQENEEMAAFCGDMLPIPERDAFLQLIAFRNSLPTSADLTPRLERIGEDDQYEQHLTMLFSRDAIFCGTQFDAAINSWLERSTEACRLLQTLEPFVLEPLLELLPEFHQRQQAEWAVRLPHILAYAIEESNDETRIKRLFLSLLFMSVNAGVASPIARVMSSKWRSSVLRVLQTWRENSVTLSQYSEPWVAGRVRATSAMISRLIGPHSTTEVDPDPTL